MFAWDDGESIHFHNAYIYYINYETETDSLEYSDLASDLGAAQKFRHETLEYVHASLLEDECAAKSASSHHIITLFGPIGSALAQNYTSSQ